MQRIKFWKMSGAGNDFILLSGGRAGGGALKKLAVRLCAPKTGIGADGLLYVNKSGPAAVSVRYFNSDGSEAFCGNGSRCAAWWAWSEGLMKNRSFVLHSAAGRLAAEITAEQSVKMRMPDVKAVSLCQAGAWPKPVKTVHFLNTGVPHAVVPVANIKDLDVAVLGRTLRYHRVFGPAGANVNFVRLHKGAIKLRTYERGVEAETLACGTGIAASAVALGLALGLGSPVTLIPVTGEKFKVWYRRQGAGAADIYVQGPAKIVFTGRIDL